MTDDLTKLNLRLGNCLSSAFASASDEKKRRLSCLLQNAPVKIDNVLQNPIKTPSYLLMKISNELGTDQNISEIITTYQFHRAITANLEGHEIYLSH